MRPVHISRPVDSGLHMPAIFLMQKTDDICAFLVLVGDTQFFSYLFGIIWLYLYKNNIQQHGPWIVLPALIRINN